MKIARRRRRVTVVRADIQHEEFLMGKGNNSQRKEVKKPKKDKKK